MAFGLRFWRSALSFDFVKSGFLRRGFGSGGEGIRPLTARNYLAYQ